MLSGRVALLTGAGGHLGSALARGLAQAGAHVLLNGRSPEKLAAVAADIQGLGGLATAYPFDACDPNDALKQIAAKHGRLDILINNAYAGRTGTIENVTAQDFQEAYQVATTAAFLMIQSALPLLSSTAQQNSGGASVINIASMYGTVSPDPGIYGDTGWNSPPHYGAAKAGLIQLTRYLACHLAPQKIRVNAISPGPFPPATVTAAWPEFHQQLCRKSPLGRVGEPHEMIGPVVFLASDAASYVTGVNLPVDGGWTAW